MLIMKVNRQEAQIVLLLIFQLKVKSCTLTNTHMQIAGQCGNKDQKEEKL